MYQEPQILEACLKCGINSIASELLTKTLRGDITCVDKIMPPTKGEIVRDVISFVQIEDTPYYISNNGSVYSSKRSRIIRPSIKGRYYVFTLSDGTYKPNSPSRRHKIHRLVAHYFVPNPEGKPFVNHINTNTFDNHYTNLEWVTNEENIKHYNSYLLQKKTTSERAGRLTFQQINDIIFLKTKGVSYKEIARIYGISEGSIYQRFTRFNVISD